MSDDTILLEIPHKYAATVAAALRDDAQAAREAGLRRKPGTHGSVALMEEAAALGNLATILENKIERARNQCKFIA